MARTLRRALSALALAALLSSAFVSTAAAATASYGSSWATYGTYPAWTGSIQVCDSAVDSRRAWAYYQKLDGLVYATGYPAEGYCQQFYVGSGVTYIRVCETYSGCSGWVFTGDQW